MQYSSCDKGRALLPAQCPLLWFSNPQPIWPTLISFTCNINGAFDIHIDWVTWILLCRHGFGHYPKEWVTNTPVFPAISFQPRLCQSQWFHWQPAASHVPNNVHWTKVLFFLQWCSPVFHESSLPFLLNIAIWIKNFRGIHSCCDLEHMFQIMISFTFWFLSNDYFTLWPFGCSQDAQSLRICEAGHQIHQTSSSLPCDFITASRAGQKALFRITLIKSYWFEQSISNSGHTEAQFISENIEHGIKAPSQGLDQP